MGYPCKRKNGGRFISIQFFIIKVTQLQVKFLSQSHGKLSYADNKKSQIKFVKIFRTTSESYIKGVCIDRSIIISIWLARLSLYK